MQNKIICFDIYIDDKSLFFDKNWSTKLKKKLL